MIIKDSYDREHFISNTARHVIAIGECLGCKKITKVAMTAQRDSHVFGLCLSCKLFQNVVGGESSQK